VFLSWVGLKGAVPITLATFPLMAGVPQSHTIFNAVFFVVLISAITQGWSLPLVARWLHIGRPADPTPALSVEINALRQVDGEIVDYTVKPRAKVAGQQLRDLALPDGVLVTLILRGRQVVMPRGGTALEPGDHVFVALRTTLQPWIDRLFDPDPEAPSLPEGLVLAFNAATSLKQLHRFFGVAVPVEIGPDSAALSLTDLLADAAPGCEIQVGSFGLRAGADQDLVTARCLADAS
jgi:cell volume regulation protein A